MGKRKGSKNQPGHKAGGKRLGAGRPTHANRQLLIQAGKTQYRRRHLIEIQNQIAPAAVQVTTSAEQGPYQDSNSIDETHPTMPHEENDREGLAPAHTIGKLC